MMANLGYGEVLSGTGPEVKAKILARQENRRRAYLRKCVAWQLWALDHYSESAIGRLHSLASDLELILAEWRKEG